MISLKSLSLSFSPVKDQISDRKESDQPSTTLTVTAFSPQWRMQTGALCKTKQLFVCIQQHERQSSVHLLDQTPRA